MNLKRTWRRLNEAVTNPHKTYMYIQNEIYVPGSSDADWYAHIFSGTEIRRKDIDRYVSEVRESNTIRDAHRNFGKRRFFLVEPPQRCLCLYILTRKYEPATVIETGVADGLSSLYILAALEENGEGQLYSIDLPHSTRDDGLQMGWLVPDSLRGRWTFRQGDAKEVLPPLARELSPDHFFHDSLHTYEHMKFEFETAYENMDGGIISSHDIQLNPAFVEFCARIERECHATRDFEVGEGPRDSPFGFVRLDQ